MQTLDAFQGRSASTLLIGTVKGGLYTLNASNDIIPFSQGLSLTIPPTAYGAIAKIVSMQRWTCPAD